MNPAHLFLGTAADNQQDMARKNRSPRAKLSLVQVAAIRADIRVQRTIAADFGIGVSQVQKIKSGSRRAIRSV